MRSVYSLFLILPFDRKDILETFVVVKNGGEDRGVCVVAGQKRDEDAEMVLLFRMCRVQPHLRIVLNAQFTLNGNKMVSGSTAAA